MELFIALFFVVMTLTAVGQTTAPPEPLKKEKRPVKTSLLSNYYEQDGNRSAVNGGLGSQELYSFTQEAAIYIPVKDSSAYKINAGVDHFTAASLTQIDKYTTSASTGLSNVSKDETRMYAGLGFDFANKGKHTLISPTIGFSKEYDVLSFNAGYSYSRFLPKKNAQFTSAVNVVVDRWMLVFPGEFRPAEPGQTTSTPTNTTTTNNPDTGTGASKPFGVKDDDDDDDDDDHEEEEDDDDDHGSGTGTGTDTTHKPYATPYKYSGRTIKKDGRTYPVDWRYSYAWTNVYAFAINKRMNAAAGLDLMMQRGMLSTPFHRVYFNDGVADEYSKEVRVEKLPRLRLKAALYGRFNYFVNPCMVLRTEARAYADSWDIQAFTATVELPVKITRWLTLGPFYRYHTQSGTSYYNGYGRHVFATDQYYTSDIDLATVSAHKMGGALRFAPLKALGISNEANTRKILSIRSIGLRYANYQRSDGLSADMLTAELNFEF